MSGICGIVHLDGAPVDRGLLQAMTAAMAFRGPDRQAIRVAGHAGLGHALLRTGGEEAGDQPLSLDGSAWITADARIDARAELRRELAAAGRDAAADCGDAALILHAYHAWGEDCVRHLLGDFAFAIWDGARRRLFCAIDPFGVKRLFYARAGARIVFGNTLDAVRVHPGVSEALDELAIADFLLFELNQDPESTAFADVRRLPAAGTFTASAERFCTSTYWDVPEARVEYRRQGDYVEHFRQLFTAAVEDRVDGHRLAIAMSGGLDSPAVAAVARAASARRARPFDLQAHTVVLDRIPGDEERHYSTLAARALGIPIHHHPFDDLRLYDGFELAEANFPDPFHGPDTAPGFALQRAASRHARVLLTGFDGDTLLNESPKPWLRALLAEGRYGRGIGIAARYALMERRLWPGSAFARAPAAQSVPPAYPAWLDPAFEARHRLRERWAQVHAAAPPADSIRPSARKYLDVIRRHAFFFDQYDPGVTRVPLECRHPFLDLRVVAFCLSLPPVPWCVRKTILRTAMRGVLPGPLLERPKTPMAAWPAAAKLAGSPWLDRFVHPPDIAPFVDRARIPAVTSGLPVAQAWMNLRPVTLSLWLRRARAVQPQYSTREMRHETA